MPRKRDPRLKRLGLSGYNKPKRTPGHPTKSHVVLAKSGSKIIRVVPFVRSLFLFGIPISSASFSAYSSKKLVSDKK